MKKTLYQILGVDPQASAQEIEAAYNTRIDELKFATMQDPNKLRVLQQSKAVLSDPVQRAAYDASISRQERPALATPDGEPERTLIQQWGKWIAAGAVLIGLFVLWPKHVATPPPQPAKPVTSMTVQPAPPSVQPAAEPAVVNNAAAPAVSVEPPGDLRENPVTGQWSCTDAISGRTSTYNFQQDGALRVASNEEQIKDFRYTLSGKTLTLTDPQQTSTLAIEELTVRKMILNTGAEGRRLVCRR